MTAVVALASVIGVSLVSPLLAAGTLALGEDRVRRTSLRLVAFAVGALLGDASIHLLPETFRDPGQPITKSLGFLAGILVLFVIEKAMRARREQLHERLGHGNESRESDTRRSPLVTVYLVGDALHNAIDGMVVGAAYLVSPTLGLSTTLAVFFHEIPHEIGDFGVYLHGGLSLRKALLLNLLTGVAALVGVSVVIVLSPRVEGLVSELVPFTAGGFVYLASSDLIPELQHERTTLRGFIEQVVAIAGGIGVMAGLRALEG